MAGDKDDDTLQQVADDKVQDHVEAEIAETDKPVDLREQLKAAIEEHRETPEKSAARAEAAAQRARDEAGRFAKEKEEREAREAKAEKEPKPDGAAAKPATEAKPVSETPEVKPDVEAASQPPVGNPPTSWSTEAKAEWSKLSPALQQAVVKREKEITDGIAGYKQRYGEIEQVIAPVRPLLQQRGLSDAQAISSAFQWHLGLAGPHGADVLRQLAQAHNIDLSTLVPQHSGAQQEDGSQQVQLPPQVLNYIQGLQQEINELKGGFGQLHGTIQQTQSERIQASLADFAKDKPDFETVRELMGRFIGSGAATDLDDAYQKARWAHPETRQVILQEEAAKREAAAKASADAERKKAEEAEAKRKKDAAEAAARARRAAVSVQTSSPSGSPAQKPAKSVSVRDSIQAAIGETRA